MCYNQTTSMIAFSISVICFSYLLYYGFKTDNKYDIFAAIVTILIGSIQLLEFFLWRSQDCSKTNHFLSLLIIVVLYSQSMIGVISSIYLFSSLKVNFLSYSIIALCSIFTGVTFFTLKWLNQHKLCSKPTINSCRLAWAPYTVFLNSLKGIFYFLSFSTLYAVIFLYAFFIQFLTFNKGFTQMSFNHELFSKYKIRHLFLFVSYLFATLYAVYYEGENYMDIFGSFWCFSSVGFGIVSCLHI